MNGKDVEAEERTTDAKTIYPSPYIEQKTTSLNPTGITSADVKVQSSVAKKKNAVGSFMRFLYDPQRKTLLGRSSLNWAKLSLFYMVFYFCLGCFFVGLLYVFATILDRNTPRYYNTESTMAVRTTATVVGMGFRPQPAIDDNMIRVSNNPGQQKRFSSSLQLYRDIYLTQKTNARTEDCSPTQPASSLPQGAACSFDWYDIVTTENHPCSDSNAFGFANEEPCVLVKLNKVYGWKPGPGKNLANTQKRRGSFTNRTLAKPHVYITCTGANPGDDDVLKDIIYYSLPHPLGTTEYGVIPNYYFPYRNARDHVQPFVLVQFKNLPLNRLISVTCRAHAPNIEHDARGMRGMTTFQLYRSHENGQSNQDL